MANHLAGASELTAARLGHSPFKQIVQSQFKVAGGADREGNQLLQK